MDGREKTWIVDGTLVPTRDHGRAAKSKSHRWSCNAQILVRWRDRRVIATSAGGPGNRNGPVHFRGSTVEPLCVRRRRVLADGGYRGVPAFASPSSRAIASSAIVTGVVIAGAALASSTPSPA